MRLRKNQVIAALKKEIRESAEYQKMATQESLKEYFNGKRFAYEKAFELLYPKEAFDFYGEIYKLRD